MAEPTPLLKPQAPATTIPHLWKGGAFVADPWRVLADAEPLPAAGRGIVSLGRWRAERSAIIATRLSVGVVAQPGDAVDPSTDDLGRLGVIALTFAKFGDGRAYSVARLLRGSWGYGGEVRAIGDVLLDQIALMLRAGFDAFQIVDAATIRALDKGALPAVHRIYQRETSGAPGIWRARPVERPRGEAAT